MAGASEPVRTCVGCRQVTGKGRLVRIVRAPDGTVGIDPGGKAPGRGAYVHLEEPCLRRAARGGLARSLRAPLGAAEAGRLLEELTRGSGESAT